MGNIEELVKALCVIYYGWSNKDEQEELIKAQKLVNKTAEYIHLLNQKEKLDDKISTYNQNK